MFIYDVTHNQNIVHICMGHCMDHRAYICLGFSVCVCVYTPSPPPQIWVKGERACLHTPLLYLVAGVTSLFHNIHLLEGFFLRRSFSHNSDLNSFLGTIFVVVIWQPERHIKSFLRKMLMPLFRSNPKTSHIICLNSFHSTKGQTCSGISSNNYI